MMEWFENESFWVAYAPLMFDASRWAEVPDAVDWITTVTAVSAPARILDLCCGVGRYSLEFARRGFAVTGVDITQAYLNALLESAIEENLSIEIARDDARKFSRPEQFDLCLNMFTSFGYFSNIDDDMQLLKTSCQNLKSGGRFILETIGKEISARDYCPYESFVRLGWNVRVEYEVIGAWEGMKNRWILENEQQRIDNAFILRLYSATELKRALFKAGFSSVRIFGGLDGRAYDHNALALVALAEK